jgi:hypothetical protein
VSTRVTISAKPIGTNKSTANPALQAKALEMIENEVRATKVKPIGTNKSTGNPEMRAKLRAWVESTSMFAIARDMKIGPSALSRYIAGLPMNTVTVLGIEASMDLLEARNSGLRR